MVSCDVLCALKGVGVANVIVMVQIIGFRGMVSGLLRGTIPGDIGLLMACLDLSEVVQMMSERVCERGCGDVERLVVVYGGQDTCWQASLVVRPILLNRLRIRKVEV
jgi:hypothetical protein